MHKHASEKADLFAQTFQNPKRRVDVSLMETQKVQAEENREILRCTVLAVEYLAKQGLSFRGHRDDKVDYSVSDANRGNFIALLQLMAKGNMVLQKHLSLVSKNARYTSKTIQNEIIHIYSCAIKEKLTRVLKEKRFPFTVIADEVTDPHEILSVCIRFLDISLPCEAQIRECFLGFLRLDRANAKMISEKILQCITDPSISLDPTCIRGQAYDGAAVMSSEIAGVQAKIKGISPLAVYTHCYAHCNLSIAAACKAQEVRNLIGLINEIYLFLNNSPKRQRAFEITLQVHLPDTSHKKLTGLCKTRWVERHTCLEVFLELYESVVMFLDSIVSANDYPELLSTAGKWDWDRETRVRAQGLKASLQTIATFIITKNVLDEVRPLASKFQKRDQDIFEAYGMVDSVIDSLENIRACLDGNFSSWYLDLAETIGVSESVPRKTSIQRNRSNTPSESPIQHYKRAIAIPLLDSLVTQLKDRYSLEERHAQQLLMLIPSVLCGSTKEIQLQSLLFWERDLPFPNSLLGEVRRWQSLWRAKSEEGANLPHNLLLSFCFSDADAFPNIYCLLLTLPITSAEAERSSLIRRLKTYARSTMSEERLSDLAVIAMQKRYLQTIYVTCSVKLIQEDSLFADVL